MCLYLQDDNVKKLGTKLIISKLKQYALLTQLRDNNANISVSSSQNDINISSDVKDLHGEQSSTNEYATSNITYDQHLDVDWEDGYVSLSAGKQVTTNTNDSDENSDSEDIQDWVCLIY